MPWKDLLKEGGIQILAVLTIIGISGWEFYVILLHGLGSRAPVLTSFESFVGAGAQPFFTVFILLCVPTCGLAWAYRRWVHNGRTPKKSLSTILILGVVVVGALLPLDVYATTRNEQSPITPSSGESTILAACGACLTVTVFFFVRRFEQAKADRYFFYGAMFVFFLASSDYYAILRGRQAAADSIKEGSGRAQLTFSDVELQKRFGTSWFVPIVESQEGILLLRFPAEHDSAGYLVLVKKSAITTTEYRIQPRK